MSSSVSWSFSANTDAAIKSLEALRSCLVATQDAAKNFGIELKHALSNLREVMTGQDMTGIKNAARELRSASSELSKVKKDAASSVSPAASPAASGGAFGAAAGAAAAGVAALASAALAAASALKNFAADAVQRAVRAEATQTRFRGVLAASGDASSASSVLSRAHDYANATGVYGDDVAIVGKISELIKAGMDAATAQVAVEAAHNAAAGDSATADQLLSIISKVAAGGELKSGKSLAATGLPVLAALQEVLGTDEEGLKKAFSDGAISADALVAAVSRVADSMGDTMDAMNNTTEAKMAQLSNIWGDVLTEFATPILGVLKPALEFIKSALSELSPILSAFGSTLKNAFSELAGYLQSVYGYMAPLLGGLKALAAAQWDLLVSALKSVFSLFKALTPVLQLVQFVLQPVEYALAGLAKTLAWVLDQISSALDWFSSKLGYSFQGSAPPSASQKLEAQDASAIEARARAAADDIAAAKAQEEAAKAQEEAAKAAKKAAEDAAKAAEREQVAREKLAMANADYERRTAILNARLSGNESLAHSLELSTSAENLARSMQAQGVDADTARQRAAEITAKQEALAQRSSASSTSSGSSTVEAGNVSRMSSVSGTVEWTSLKTPMEVQTQHLQSLETITQNILEYMRQPGSPAAPVLL